MQLRLALTTDRNLGENSAFGLCVSYEQGALSFEALAVVGKICCGDVGIQLAAGDHRETRY